MKAVGLFRYLPIDHPESLLDLEIDKPVATGHDLLVKVHAISVNPVDYKRRAPKDLVETTPRVLGFDVAGVVESAGPDVTLFKPGDAVYYAGSVVRQGGNSEFHLVDERIVGRKPRNLGFAEAAALPLTTLTAWEALFDRMGLSREGAHAGRTLLIIAGAGGVGSIAIQLAKQLARLTVIATASRPESIAWARNLGADHIIDHGRDLAPQLAAAGMAEVDYVLCCNNADHYLALLAPIIKPQGRICTIVGTQQPVHLMPYMQKSASICWEYMFTRSTFNTPDMIEQHRLLNDVAAMIEAGTVRTTVATHLGKINAANLKRAHKTLEEGHALGKIVLEGF
ncbi:MAG: zinc-binding alcohol dehydrogenase family protein [Betaproteobacteria bacterium]|nr:zinc-binding alcohol dehydrogenase family protein [Betaproteobacteria bacterium]